MKLLRLFLWRWKYRSEWGGICSMHGTECPCKFIHGTLGEAWWIPYRKNPL